ncbi:unnamed protein product, partial [marine sediment metagenome]
ALQYGNPMGIPDLRQAVIDRFLEPKELKATLENIIIVAGGIESLNLVSQLYLEPGDVILVESPTFVHAVQVFKMFQARCIACETDDHGFVIEEGISGTICGLLKKVATPNRALHPRTYHHRI